MKVKIIAAALLLAGIATNAHSQSTITATTEAILVQPIAITKTTDLHFGTIASSGLPGTVAIDYGSVRSSTGGVTLIPTGTGTPATTAVFGVTGNNASISILVPTSAIPLTGNSVGLSVGDFSVEGGLSQMIVANVLVLKVKATLTVPANATGGTYTNATGLFVTVNYN